MDISKKTQAQKNSKLKENPEKTQAKFRKNSETGNSSWVELVLNWMKTQFLGGKLKGTPKNSLFIIKYFQKLENICTFFKCSQKLMKKLKTQAKSWKNSSQNSKKNSKTGNSSWVELAENCPTKKPGKAWQYGDEINSATDH